MLDGRQWPVLQIYACRNSVWSMLTSLLLLSGAPLDVALRQGRGCARSSTACRPLARRAYSGSGESGDNTTIGHCSLAAINRGNGCASHAAHGQEGTWYRLDFVGGGQKVKAAVGAALTFETHRGTGTMFSDQAASFDTSSRRRASAPVSKCFSAQPTGRRFEFAGR